MRHHRLIFATLGCCALLGLSACGPMYQTSYTFVQPPTMEGRTCVLQCEQLRLQCRQYEDLKVDNCENQNRYARADYDRCKRAGFRDCTLDTTWCSADYDRCEEQYRICYQSCGGQVIATTVCVANCEQAPQPQPVQPQPQYAPQGQPYPVQPQQPYPQPGQ